MRTLIVEVPKGELSKLQGVTLVEAEKVEHAPEKKHRRFMRGAKQARQLAYARGVTVLFAGGGKLVRIEGKPAEMTPAKLASKPAARMVTEAMPKLTREQRKAVLAKSFGLFKGRADAPQDGLAFQLEMRTE